MIRPIEHPGGSYTGFDIKFGEVSLIVRSKLHPFAFLILITVPGTTL